MTYPKYLQNLRSTEIHGVIRVYSYNTLVAKQTSFTELTELGKWSSTTSKHVNYACKYHNLTLIPATK